MSKENPIAQPFKIIATWDSDARIWVAESNDVPGLILEAYSPDQLIYKLKVLIPELLELNGREAGTSIPFNLSFAEILTASAQQRT